MKRSLLPRGAEPFAAVVVMLNFDPKLTLPVYIHTLARFPSNRVSKSHKFCTLGYSITTKILGF
jgi:hypothetical protein